MVPFAYKEKAPDGALYVYGKATGPQLDLDEQIVDADWARTALGEWFKAAANIRQMHSPHLPPAGKGIELTEKDDGFWLRSKIVEPGAIKLVEEGVYGGLSIGIKGPRIQRDMAAKNGRIVGGKVVETSLVDYPCHEGCKIVDISKEPLAVKAAKFVVAQAVDDQTVEYVGKADEQDPLSKWDIDPKAAKPRVETASAPGEGKPNSQGTTKPAGNRETDDDIDAKDKADKCMLASCGCGCDGLKADKGCDCDCITCGLSRGEANDAYKSMVASWAEIETGIYKREFSTEQRRQLAGRGHALPDGSYPIETVGDLSNAISAYGRAKNKPRAKRHIMARARALGKSDMIPDGWRKGVDYDVLAKMHDILCPAYDLADVLMTHPDVAKNGLALSLGPSAIDAIRQMLIHEIDESTKGESGAMSGAYDVENLAKIYASLCSYVQSERWQEVSERVNEAMRTVRADAYKAYSEQFPNTRLNPRDAGPMNARRFGRAYLASGHYREVAGSQDATPGRNPTDVGADDFMRGWLGSGHQRQSPGDVQPTYTNAGYLGARNLNAAASTAQVRTAMQVMHDSLRKLDSAICPLTAAGEPKPVDHNMGGFPKPTNVTASQVNGTTISTRGTEPDLIKSGELVVTTATTTAQDVDAIVADRVKAELEIREADWSQKMAALQERMDKLAAEPDPRQAPHRGSMIERPQPAVVDAPKTNPDPYGMTDPDALMEFAGKSAQPQVRAWAIDRAAELRKARATT